MFRSMSLKKYISVIQKNQSTAQDDLFMKPDPTKVTGMRHGSYDKINEKGFAPEETVVNNNDIIICKVSPIQPVYSDTEKKELKIYKDNSEVYKGYASGVVDRVWTNIYNNEGYQMIKTRIRSERIPRIGDKYCIPKTAEAEVLTNKGWKKIEDITMDDEIATLDRHKYLKYEKPVDVYNFKYNGKIYKLRSQLVDFDVTMDHELYVRKRDKKEFEFVQAKDIMGKRYNLKKDCINTNPDVATFDLIEGISLDMNKWLKYFGIWMAEGWANTYNEGTSSVCYQTTICQTKPRVCEKIKEIITELNYKYCEHDNNEKITISNKPLAQYMSKLSVGALNKSLPDWVWNLSQNQSRILLEHLIMGDGTTSKQSGSVCYYTSSKKLANDIMKLSIHAGWSASIKLNRPAGTEYNIEGRTGTTNADALCVGIVKSKNEPQINHGHINTQNGQSEETYDYEGDVYCLEVPSHVFMMRQNNKNVWIGNCSRHGQKGTIGILLKSSDMPFTKDGIQPDIILNPNAIPSRMTIAQLIECILGKVSAIEGHDADGTPFNDVDLEEIKDRLQNLGYNRNGVEYLYNGMTGQKMRVMIFIGPTYYQRLKHLVEDKIHCLKMDHEILTKEGWKTFDKLNDNDKVLTLNAGVSEFNSMKKLYYPDYEGEIYYVKNDKIDLAVTPEHRMLVSVSDENGRHWDDYKLIKISELKNKTVKYINENYDEIIVDHRTDLTIKTEKCSVFCLQVPGEVFYVRHNNIAVWTGNSRSRGPRTILTRQCPEGRSRDGGLRLGEMERDSLIGHGMAKFLKEKMLDTADAYTTYVCGQCGLFAQRLFRKDSEKYVTNRDIFYCPACKNYTQVSKIMIPYAFKLFIQELMSMNIAPRIKTKQSIYNS